MHPDWWAALPIFGIFPGLVSTLVPSPTRFRVLGYGFPFHANSYASFKASPQCHFLQEAPFRWFVHGVLWRWARLVLHVSHGGSQAVIPTGPLNDTYSGPAGLGWAKAGGGWGPRRVPRAGECKVSRACSHALWLRSDPPSVGPAAGAGRRGGGVRRARESPVIRENRKNRHAVSLQNHYIQLINKPGGEGGREGGTEARRSGWRGPGRVLEGAQAAVAGRTGLAETWLLVEASKLRQQLLDEVLRTRRGS